jgi:hypothetical protein
MRDDGWRHREVGRRDSLWHRRIIPPPQGTRAQVVGREDLRRRAIGGDPAVADEQQAVREARREVQVVDDAAKCPAPRRERRLGRR